MNKYKLIFIEKSENKPLKLSKNISKIKSNNYVLFLKDIFFNKILYKLFINGLFILSYYLYYLSLEKCFDGFDACGTRNNWISKKSLQALISVFILTLLFEGMIYKIVAKIYFFHTILFYFIIYKYSHGLDFHDHGFYNFFGCLSIFIVFLIILTPFNILLFLIKRKYKLCILIYIFIILFLIIIFYYIIIVHYMNCEGWEKGLNNTYIENNPNIYPCQIKFPKICPFKLGAFFLDITKWKGLKCEQKHNVNTKLKLLHFSNHKYINTSAKRIGFPLLNKNNKLFLAIKDNDHKLKKFIKNNIVDMDNKELVMKIYKQNIPEIIVDYNRKQNGELNININFNKTLSEERKNLEKKTTPYSSNIMVIYIDSVSRANSIRKLKKTLKFFEYFMPFKGGSNPKYPSENYHSFQFFKYHSFSSYTRYNYMQIFYGNYYKSVDDKNMVRITKYLKENGYITGYINDMCLREPTNTGHDMHYEEIGDHEFLLCDPNMISVHSHTIRCLYDKISTQYLYEYGNQFWRKYKNNRKFLSIITNDGHEGTIEVLKYIDDILYNFLYNLYDDNLFQNTTIFLLSDHGTAAPSPYYINNFYQIERHLPMLYIISNDRKNISYKQQYEYIQKNQQILVTGYDIYNTIGHLIFGDKYYLIPNKNQIKDTPKTNLGISLFNKINSKERTPKNYKNMNINICL